MRPSPPALAGLALIAAALLAPLWANLGTAVPERPQLAAPSDGPCLDAVATMRRTHMLRLYDWRDQAVRAGRRAPDPEFGGQRASLRTCLGCHEKKDFCDVCHATHGVSPDCWTCHGEE